MKKGNVIIGLIVIGAIIWGATALGKNDAVTESYYTPSVNRFDRYDDPEVERSYAEYGDRDCSDFSSQDEAQEFFEDEGGPDEDYHNLDRDGDGVVCESI